MHIVTELDKKNWSNFVRSHPQGNVFQTPQMYEVYKNTKHWEPVFLAVLDNEDNILGILLATVQKEFSGAIARFTSRAVISGGPLIDYNRADRDIVNFLLKELDGTLRGKVLYSQFRNLWDFSDQKEYFINNNYRHKEHFNFSMNLEEGGDYLWNNLYSERRGGIRKAIKEALHVRILSNALELERSYKILKIFYKRIKIPLPDKTFFEVLYKTLVPESMLNIFLAYYKDEIIGTLYLLVHGEKLYISYVASLYEYYSKRPNDLLYWEAIKWGCQNGFKILDFGGAGNIGEKYGVRKFKEEFGGRLVNHGRFTKIYQPLSLSLIEYGLRLWKKI